MKKQSILFLVLVMGSLSVYTIAQGGIGDGTGPFNSSPSQEDNSTSNTEGSGASPFEKREEHIFGDPASGDTPPDNPPDPSAPLDGGASILLLSGTGIALRKIYQKSKNKA